MNIERDTNGYTNDFSFVHEYGENVLSLIDAPKDSTAPGCVSGALTESIREAVCDERDRLYINNEWFAGYMRIRMKAVRE